MLDRPLSRRQLLRLSGGAALSLLFGRPSYAKTNLPARIGVVLPAAPRGFRLTPSSAEIAANAARRGAVLAEEALVSSGVAAQVLYASAPDAEAAARAAERLVARDEVMAIVGGVGAGQAEALAEVTTAHDILFFNTGSASASLRGGEHGSHSFHVEASEPQYLSALARWYAGTGVNRWFLVHPASEDGHRLKVEASRAVVAATGGEAQVLEFEVPETPIFHDSIAAVRRAKPDLVAMLLDWRGQLEFMGQYEAAGLEPPITGFPVPVTQSREFYRAVRSTAPRTGTGARVALWEATLSTNDARELNEEFFARWGEPMDPSAWATYQATTIIADAVERSGTVESGKLIDFLEGDEATFDVAKGKVVAFSSADHQLQQPLYMVRIDARSDEPWDLGVLLARM